MIIPNMTDTNTTDTNTTDTNTTYRCGYVALVGRPNVGKSTLSNALIGTKVSITSRKAQTTRHRIMGILTREDAQFVFVDTPGFQTRHGGAMNRMMNRVVSQTLAGVDVVLFLVQAGQWSAADEALLAQLPKDASVILVLSKTDLIKDKGRLFPFTAELVPSKANNSMICWARLPRAYPRTSLTLMRTPSQTDPCAS